MRRFVPAVEALEDRTALSEFKPSSSLKRELEAFAKGVQQKMSLAIRPPRTSVVRLSRASGAAPKTPASPRSQPQTPPRMKLEPDHPLNLYWIVWHPRLGKYFSIGDNRWKDSAAILGGDAVLTPYGVVVTSPPRPKPQPPKPKPPRTQPLRSNRPARAAVKLNHLLQLAAVLQGLGASGGHLLRAGVVARRKLVGTE